ncbi:HtaA domain-containing protein [Actinomadura soli]|nr:HtaA domain-containing protein [Actinomadura soli]
MHNQLPQLGRGLVAMGSALIVTGLATGAAAALADAPGAPAAAPAAVQSPVAAGHLDWRRDVPSQRPQAPRSEDEPKVTAGDGATLRPDGTIRFPVGAGGYDAASGSATVTYWGTATFTYPGRTVTLRNPVMTVNRSAATVKAQLGEGPNAGATPSPDAPSDLLTLRTSGLPPVVSGPTVTWNEVPADLTAAGQQALGDDGGTGEVTVALTLAQAAPAATQPGPRALAATTPATTASPTGTSTATPTAQPTDCVTPAPTGSAPGTASPSTTPPASTAATPSGSASPSTTPTGTASPGATDCPTTPGSPGGPGEAADNGPGGGNGSLPKTGDSFMIPLTLTGGAMVTLGGGSILVARRRLVSWE